MIWLDFKRLLFDRWDKLPEDVINIFCQQNQSKIRIFVISKSLLESTKWNAIYINHEQMLKMTIFNSSSFTIISKMVIISWHIVQSEQIYDHQRDSHSNRNLLKIQAF